MKKIICLLCMLVPAASCPLPAEEKPKAQAPQYELETVKIQKEDIVAKVNGRLIGASELYGRLVSAGEARKMLNLMIREVIVGDEAKKQQLSVTGPELQDAMAQMQKQFGTPTEFDEWMKNQGLSVDELKTQITTNLLEEKLVVKARKLEVTKKEIQEFFDNNKEKLSTPEQVRCRYILVKDKQKADDLALALRAGADFDIMAKAKSEDPANKENAGGDTGFFARGTVAKEIEDAAFALKIGEIGGPVKVKQGYYIMKMVEKKAAKPATFDKETQAHIKDYLLHSKISNTLSGYLTELESASKIEIY